MNTIKTDTLIVGAGLIGSSLAMHLGQMNQKNKSITCLDFDLEGELSSSELNAGGVRATFLQPCNIRSSRVSIDYYSRVADEVGYRACGYLWLHGQASWSSAQKVNSNHGTSEWPFRLLSPTQIKSEYPFLDRLEGVEGAILGARDGLINPNLLKMHYRNLARAQGVAFEDRLWVEKVQFELNRILVHVLRLPKGLSYEDKHLISTVNGTPANTKSEVIECNQIVNCAGPWAGQLAKILGYSSPCQPVRRQISIFSAADVDLTPYGMIVDTSGVYFHPEASNGLAGFAEPTEKSGFRFDYDGESFFQEKVWPALYERSTYFEKLKHVTGWAGLYEISPDESAIVGQVEEGTVDQQGRVFEAHSFSGHGAMHSYAAGLALAERMVYGQYRTVDFAEFSAQRFKTGKLIHESWVI